MHLTDFILFSFSLFLTHIHTLMHTLFLSFPSFIFLSHEYCIDYVHCTYIQVSSRNNVVYLKLRLNFGKALFYYIFFFFHTINNNVHVNEVNSWNIEIGCQCSLSFFFRYVKYSIVLVMIRFTIYYPYSLHSHWLRFFYFFFFFSFKVQ